MHRIRHWLAPALVMLALAVSAPAQAADPDHDLAAVLASHQGKRVTLVLSSGTELSGTLTAVEGDIARLAELSGREYFDAVIDLDHVEAVVYRARTP